MNIINELQWDAINNFWQRFLEKDKNIINNNLRLTELLGWGGNGAVYKATNLLNDESVGTCAIKLVPAEDIEFNELRFSYKHPNLVYPFFKSEWKTKTIVQGEEKDIKFFYILMELADAQLKPTIKDTSMLTKIIQDVATGLVYLHDKKIVHRDIKPENVLRFDDTWKISDFGLVRGLNQDDKDFIMTKNFKGTEPYAPPEAFGMGKNTEKSDEKKSEIWLAWDMWSLGVMIVKLWTNKYPFNYSDLKHLPDDQFLTEYGDRLMNAEPIIQPWLPKPFDQIVEGCLKKDPSKRLTAQQILEILNPPPPPPPPPPPLPPPKFRFEVVTVNREGKIINKEWKEAEYYEEKLGKGVILEMVKIPAGEFMMGAKEGEKGASSDEYPQHKVIIAKPFYMGKYPITQAQYEAIMGKNPSRFKGEKRPVECVSWDMAQEFCKKLSEKTGKEYSLPSEAKWEYVARAGTTTPFHYGETLTTDLANYDGNYTYGKGPKGIYREETTEVGIFPPNSFGLYDIHGNVWEWCEDVYHLNYKEAPTDGSAWLKNHGWLNAILNVTLNLKTLRGGSWNNSPYYCRVAVRYLNVRPDIYNKIGFRVSCAVV